MGCSAQQCITAAGSHCACHPMLHPFSASVLGIKQWEVSTAFMVPCLLASKKDLSIIAENRMLDKKDLYSTSLSA